MPTVLVTGTSRGIGKAAAELLRKRGCHVIGHASRHGNADTVNADLLEPSAPQDLWEQALERAGGRSGNKGWDAAIAALELCGLYEMMEARSAGA